MNKNLKSFLEENMYCEATLYTSDTVDKWVKRALTDGWEYEMKSAYNSRLKKENFRAYVSKEFDSTRLGKAKQFSIYKVSDNGDSVECKIPDANTLRYSWKSIKKYKATEGEKE